jgi:hypothetical protein
VLSGLQWIGGGDKDLVIDQETSLVQREKGDIADTVFTCIVCTSMNGKGTENSTTRLLTTDV